jgi:HSP20 family protein
MARDDRQQYNLPARQQPSGQLSRSPFGWGREADFWSGSPFQLMRRMQEDMDRIFGSLVGQTGGTAGMAAPGMSGWMPSVDVYETDKEIVVKADLPGVEPEDLEVYCTDDALVLRGETRREDDRQEGNVHRTERSYGRFERQIPLPPGVRSEEIQANFRNGVLELRVPKSEEATQRMRRIPIGGASASKGGESGSKGGEASSMTANPSQVAPPASENAGKEKPGGKK